MVFNFRAIFLTLNKVVFFTNFVRLAQDPDPGCENIRYGSGSRANFYTDPDPGKNDTDPDPAKKDYVPLYQEIL